MIRAAIVAALLLQGCAMTPLTGSGSGGGYVLHRTNPDGTTCKVEASSRRELETADIEIGENCTLRATVKDVSEASALADALRATTGSKR